jgi:hypothetical protein
MSQHILEHCFLESKWDAGKFVGNIVANYALTVFTSVALQNLAVPLVIVKYAAPAVVLAGNLIFDAIHGEVPSDTTIASAEFTLGTQLAASHYMLLGAPLVIDALVGGAYSVVRDYDICKAKEYKHDSVDNSWSSSEQDSAAAGCASLLAQSD